MVGPVTLDLTKLPRQVGLWLAWIRELTAGLVWRMGGGEGGHQAGGEGECGAGDSCPQHRHNYSHHSVTSHVEDIHSAEYIEEIKLLRNQEASDPWWAWQPRLGRAASLPPGGGAKEQLFQVLLDRMALTPSHSLNETSLLCDRTAILTPATLPTTPRQKSRALTLPVVQGIKLERSSWPAICQDLCELSGDLDDATDRESDQETIVTLMSSSEESDEDDDPLLPDSGDCFRHGTFFLSSEQLESSLARAKGVVRTRFPPEPNGPLHLGHAKALFINFRVAGRYGGECVLRFDDTNPKTAEKRYCDAALEMIKWLGYQPATVSYTSDYFDGLFMCACQLIIKGKAYVCHMRPEITPHVNKHKQKSPWRNRSIEENLREFGKMCLGDYKEGEAVLRMKVRTRAGLCDPVAYRVCSKDHHRTGTRWRIFPTYNFSHPIVDSWEGIAVSLCTSEFACHRSLYQWVQRSLSLPKVPQREFQRLEIYSLILSKRHLTACQGQSFSTFDDPRLATLAGLRRRGIPPEAVCRFVSAGYRDYSQLLDITREILLSKAPHRVLVLKPLICHVINYSAVAKEEGQSPVRLQVVEQHTGSLAPTRLVPLSPTIYINKFDFSLTQGKHFFTPKCPVHLRGTSYVMQFSRADVNDEGDVLGLDVVLRRVQAKEKFMKVLTWVSEPATVTINLVDSPRRTQGSLLPHVYSARVLAEPGLLAALKTGRDFAHGQTFQAVRFAYVTLDPSSSEQEAVFNVTCLLRLHHCLQTSISEVFSLSATQLE